jgi:hypothetical protein
MYYVGRTAQNSDISARTDSDKCRDSHVDLHNASAAPPSQNKWIAARLPLLKKPERSPKAKRGRDMTVRDRDRHSRLHLVLWDLASSADATDPGPSGFRSSVQVLGQG